MSRQMPRTRRAQTTMRLRPDLIGALDEIAKRRSLSRTQLVERALVEFVNDTRRQKPELNDLGEEELFA